jgi:hypothetical protein
MFNSGEDSNWKQMLIAKILYINCESKYTGIFGFCASNLFLKQKIRCD